MTGGADPAMLPRLHGRHAARGQQARVAKLAYAPDLGSGAARHGGSSPPSCTTSETLRNPGRGPRPALEGFVARLESRGRRRTTHRDVESANVEPAGADDRASRLGSASLPRVVTRRPSLRRRGHAAAARILLEDVLAIACASGQEARARWARRVWVSASSATCGSRRTRTSHRQPLARRPRQRF